MRPLRASARAGHGVARYCNLLAASCAAFQRRYPACMAASERALPSGVRGPVDKPPCNRHLPFGSTLHRHRVPLRVRAPHNFFRLIVEIAPVNRH